MPTSVNPLYKSLTNAKDSNVTVANLDIWLNELCTRVETLEKQAAIKDAKIIELERKCDALEKSATPGASTPEAAANFWEKLPKNISNVISNIASKENSELIKKENHLIISGIPESTAESAENKSEEDIRIVKSVLSAIGIDDIEESRITRFKKKTDSSKPGQILLVCANKALKSNIQKAARQLKEHRQHNTIYINNDLTIAQLDEDKKLRTDRNERNSKLPHAGVNGLKHGLHKFNGDVAESKFYWGIRNKELRKIKIV